MVVKSALQWPDMDVHQTSMILDDREVVIATETVAAMVIETETEEMVEETETVDVLHQGDVPIPDPDLVQDHTDVQGVDRVHLVITRGLHHHEDLSPPRDRRPQEDHRDDLRQDILIRQKDQGHAQDLGPGPAMTEKQK